MQVGRVARIVFGLNALVVAVGVIVQLFVTADLDSGYFDTPLKRTLNVFAFFTIQSNILVGIGSGMLALGRAPATTWFRAVRLTGLVGITLTFVVFHAVLRDLQDLTGNAKLADFLLHTVSPVLCVGGWLWFGPRNQTSKPVVWWSLAFPRVGHVHPRPRPDRRVVPVSLHGPDRLGLPASGHQPRHRCGDLRDHGRRRPLARQEAAGAQRLTTLGRIAMEPE